MAVRPESPSPRQVPGTGQDCPRSPSRRAVSGPGSLELSPSLTAQGSAQGSVDRMSRPVFCSFAEGFMRCAPRSNRSNCLANDPKNKIALITNNKSTPRCFGWRTGCRGTGRCSWAGGALVEVPGMTLRSADRNVAERDRAITLERDQTRGAPGAVPGSVQISAVGTGVECSCLGSWFFPSRIKRRPRTGCRHHVVRSGCATHSGQASGCTGAAPESLCRAHRCATRWCGMHVVRRRSIRTGALTVNARHSRRFR